MASIFKRPRSPYFFCSFRNGDGRWLKKSTKQTDKKKALATCVSWEAAATSASKKALTTAQARRVFNELLEQSGDEPLESFTIGDWMAEWLTEKKNGVRFACVDCEQLTKCAPISLPETLTQ